MTASAILSYTFRPRRRAATRRWLRMVWGA
jgi:hypothetical protein